MEKSLAKALDQLPRRFIRLIGAGPAMLGAEDNDGAAERAAQLLFCARNTAGESVSDGNEIVGCVRSQIVLAHGEQDGL